MTRFFHDTLATEVGPLAIISDEQSRLRAALWDADRARLEKILRNQCRSTFELVDAKDAGGFTSALASYVAGKLEAIDDLAVEASGTPFQRSVWRELREIPTGTTISYSELAQRIGRPSAVRAVGLANGANPICIVVPCHRVIGASKSLTGYGGGLERKAWLLQHEGCRLL